jgi:erythromycin esterase-like protein
MLRTVTSVLDLLPSRPRILALGEPTHGEDLLLEVRNDLFRHLVDHEGYRTIAIESDCLMGLVVDDYVTTGEGTLDDVMARGFSHTFGESAANRDLVRWMRAYNQDRPAADHVRFAGADAPTEIAAPSSPRQAVISLHAYLSSWVDPDLLPCTAEQLEHLLGTDERWTEPATMLDPTRSVGRTPDADRLRLLADDLAALLDAQTPHLLAVSSRDDWDRARLYARTATGLLLYHFWMADSSPARLPRLTGVRDSIFAGNLLAAAHRRPLLVHAHNLHLQREKSRMQMGGLPLEWWGAGSIVSAHLGPDYAFLAGALGTIRHQGVGTPPPDTLEGMLYSLPKDHFLIDASFFDDVKPVPRVSPWFGYFPLDPAHLSGVDGIVFVRDTPAEPPR